MLWRNSPRAAVRRGNVSVEHGVNLHSVRMWELPMKKPSKTLPFAAAFLLTLSGLAFAQTSGGAGAGAGGASSTGAGIGASGLTGSSASAIASPTTGAATTDTSAAGTGTAGTGTASPGTLGTGRTVPGTGTTGPAASASAGGGAGTAVPCPPGLIPEGVGETRRCRPLSGTTATDSTGIAAPPSIMAPPTASGAR